MEIQQDMTISEKLKILTDAAKYDVACTSSGVDRNNKGKGMGDAHACGICHTFASDGRCVSLLKILYTNKFHDRFVVMIIRNNFIVEHLLKIWERNVLQ